MALTILVTGGAGFIGSHVCARLIQRGDKVICIDDFNEYYPAKFKRENIVELLQNDSHFYLYEKDIRNNLKDIFEKHSFDKIIHLAARVGVRASIDNPVLYTDVNINGTINLLELAKKFNIRTFIFASSSSVYGGNKKIPFSENDDASNPVSQYATTKRTGELLCRTYHNLYNLNVTCLRFFTVYGPRGRSDMAPYKFTDYIMHSKEIEKYGLGNSKRDYTYIDDIIAGIMTATDKSFPFEIINLGNNEPIELNYFITVIEDLLKKKAKIKPMPEQQGDVAITYADISKAKNLLNYDPQIKIEEGMKRFIEWYNFKRNA